MVQYTSNKCLGENFVGKINLLLTDKILLVDSVLFYKVGFHIKILFAYD